MATVIRVAAVISISIIAVSIAGSVRGSTCDTCECPLSNVEIINDIINARINATITSWVEEFTASFEERMNATLDEEIETIHVNHPTLLHNEITSGYNVNWQVLHVHNNYNYYSRCCMSLIIDTILHI